MEKTKETDEKLKAKGIDVGAGVNKTTKVLVDGVGLVAAATINMTHSFSEKISKNENAQ